MIIKNSFIKIDKTTYIFILLLCISGLIKEFISISILVIFHELGHFIFGKLFKWNIKKIIIYPFGGLTKYDDLIDKPLFEEFIITLMGPIFQIIIYAVLFLFNKELIISDYFFSIIKNYHYSMLIFNLIPIIPLDGSKVLNIILNKIFSFRVSYIVLLFISLVISIIFTIYTFNNISYIFLLSYIITEIYLYYKNRHIIFNRFIYEKYLYKNKYSSYIKINSINKMKRNKKHLIKYNNIYLSEKNAIKKIKGV